MSKNSLDLCLQRTHIIRSLKKPVPMNDLRKISLVSGDLRLLIARNGISLILISRLFSLKTSCFYGREKFQKFLFCRQLSLIKNGGLHLSIILHELVSNLIDAIKRLYDSDKVQFHTLQQVLNSVLETFLRRRDAALIDQFAILNTLRKKGFCFRHDSKYWEVSFGQQQVKIEFGRTQVLCTLDSNFFFQKFRLIMSQLEQNSNQHDLLCLMYQKILRDPRLNKRVVPSLPIPFELNICTNWRFWVGYLSWNTARINYLSDCKRAFVSQSFFSNKYRKRCEKDDSIKSSNSFLEFFQIPCIAFHDEFRNELPVLDFNPI